MRKNIKKTISIFMIILLLGLVITGCVEKKPNTLTEEQKIEDFEYMYKIIKANYPFLEVNKRVNGIDWLAKKDEFMKEIKRCKNDEEYTEKLQNILSLLNNGHTKILDKDFYEYLLSVCRDNKGAKPWLAELTQHHALKRYGYDMNKETDNSKRENVELVSVKDNVETKIVDDNIAYMKIKCFLINNAEMNKEQIRSFIKEIKELDALIIDIRGNKGGYDSFWKEGIVSSLIEKTLSTDFYLFIRGGEFTEKFLNKNALLEVNKAQHFKNMKYLPPEILSDFKYYSKETIYVTPCESIKFKGRIFLLVDKNVYSSAEKFAVFAKETGFATLIGEKTGGDGIIECLPLCTLPNSGLVMRFSTEMGTAESGICNEEHKTTPDYIVDAEITENIEDDKCIQKVMELIGK
ncbi:S41 family peptidase [Oceanirhabdus sp. W0125-5]|uniref:S41 family peptidase n=1 Tax=Oceanirhabdus sp. W0125-5 TaxID=2999116 RepID=UPI0022F2DDF8|nr:S41 family peptidase [Oceanirhabdus sp. W0125-5]WBW95823.1 S41 family peptidase [Oceanirhabdus sp. W0125-5]